MAAPENSLPLRTPGDALLSLLQAAWRHRFLVFGAVVLGGAIGVAISFLVRPAYRPDVLAAYVAEQGPSGALGALAGELGGLAALAGMGEGLSQGRDEVLAFLSSRELGRAFIEQQKLGAILLDEPATTAVDWRRAYRQLDREVRRVTPDKKSGAIRISMQWSDAKLATLWANEYVALANGKLREKAMAQSEARLRFLNEQLGKTGQLEVRDAVARVIESEMRTAMIASARADFALKVIDPAVEPLPAERFKPRRGLYGALGALLAVAGVLAFLAARSLR
jgi:uncharacterized protein involved in exopolysaccharide biosynthesis